MNTQKCFKKALSIILSLVMVLTAVPFAFAADYDKTGATKLTFSNDGITAEKGSYSGYKIEGTALSIKDSGTYILSGKCADGSVTVKKGVKGVTLVLNGLTLTSSDTAPLTCNKSSEATIIAENGTVNTLTDAAYNNDDTYPENENAENAVIKCKDGSKVTLCGTGTLNIVSNGKNGIKSGATTEEEGEASLTIKEITLNITTTINDGINAEQLLNIESGNITVSAADDGLHCDRVFNIGKEGTAGPVIRITKSYEGLEAANFTVYSGDVEVHSSDDGINAANSDLDKNYAFSMDFVGGKTVVYADNGDGLDSNGTINISGGTVIVWTQNKADNSALDSDSGISITGGTVFAAGGSGGMGMKLSTTQPCVVYGSTRMGFGSFLGKGLGISAGDTMTVKDSAGNVVYEATAAYDINSVVFSSADLTADSSYTLFSGSKEAATATTKTGENISGGSIFGGGSSCMCLCHKDGILGIFWKLFLNIYKLFGINKTCRCGAVHY